MCCDCRSSTTRSDSRGLVVVTKLLILGLAFVLFGPASILLAIGVLMNPAVANFQVRSGMEFQTA